MCCVVLTGSARPSSSACVFFGYCARLILTPLLPLHITLTQQALLASVNRAVDRIGSMLDWQLLEFKDGMKAFKSPGLDVPLWRKGAEQRAERAFVWLEARADGRLPLPQQLPQAQGQGQRR